MRRPALLLCMLVLGCGRGSATGPTAGPPAEPAPASRHPVSGVVFYDENANGQLDAPEEVRLPGVAVTLGDRTAASGADGRFEIGDAPAGQRFASVVPDTLPPFFGPGLATSMTVPAPAPFLLTVPVALPIGTNHPNVYMAFGDSITSGDGSRGGRGYRVPLADMVRAHWGGHAVVEDEGVTATKSDAGALRLPDSLARVRPAYTLVHYGTNDWNGSNCRHVQLCYTLPSLRQMVRTARAAGSVPVVATLIPVNPAANEVRHRPADRNAWILEMNASIKQVVPEEGGVVADLHAVFAAEGEAEWPRLFSDHVHPNERGYDLMAEGFFRAIVRPRGAR